MKKVKKQTNVQLEMMLGSVNDSIKDDGNEPSDVSIEDAMIVTGMTELDISDCHNPDPYTGFKNTIKCINHLKNQLSELLIQAEEYAHKICTFEYEDGELDPEIINGYKSWVSKELEYLNSEHESLNKYDVNDVLYPVTEEIKAYQKHTRDQLKAHIDSVITELKELSITQNTIINEQEPTGQIGGEHDLKVMYDKESGKMIMTDNNKECMSVDNNIISNLK